VHLLYIMLPMDYKPYLPFMLNTLFCVPLSLVLEPSSFILDSRLSLQAAKARYSTVGSNCLSNVKSPRSGMHLEAFATGHVEPRYRRMMMTIEQRLLASTLINEVPVGLI